MTRWIRVLRRLNRFFDYLLVWPQHVAAVNDRAAADVLSALPAARPSLGLLAQRAREHRKEVIDHNDALDRKLTTMMTAAGAYFGLLVNATVRDSTTNDSPWMLLALVMAVLSVLVALYGLTPRAFNAPNLEWLVSAAVDDEEDTVTWFLLHQDLHISHVGRAILHVKGSGLRKAGAMLFLSVCLTMTVTIVEGV